MSGSPVNKAKIIPILFAVLLVFFGVSFTTAQSCGTKYRNAQTYTSYLKSPYYPYNYPSSTRCEWVITAPFGYRVELSFVAFDTEGTYLSGSCSSLSSDILEVYDGRFLSSSKLLGKYCKNYLPANVYSSGTSLYLRFTSDSFTERKGFNIKYKAVTPKPDSSICSPFNTYSQNNNIQLSGSSGYIKSPLYGTKYPSNIQCTWVITVPVGEKIKLTFSDFTVGPNSYYCNSFYHNYDQLQIRDGRYSFSSTLKTLCGTSLPSAIYSSGRYLWIQFKSNSDNYNTRSTTGFKAKYEIQSTSSTGNTALVVGIVIAVGIVIFLVCICICIAQKKRTPGHVTVRAPATQTTTIQGTQNPAATTYQYPQQIQGGFVPPQPVGQYPAAQSGYPPPTTGYPQGGYQYPAPGSYPMSSGGGGNTAPGYPPKTSVPMMPYPQQPVPNDPPPAYPGPPAYPPQAATGQPPPSNPNTPYPPTQGAEIQQPPPSNPNPPYPPTQGAEIQQSAPPYPPAQDTKQATAPPPF